MDTLERRLGGATVRGYSGGSVFTRLSQKRGRIVVRGVGRVNRELTVLEVLVASVAILLA